MAVKQIMVHDWDGELFLIPENLAPAFEEWLLYREGERAGAHYSGPDFEQYRTNDDR